MKVKSYGLINRVKMTSGQALLEAVIALAVLVLTLGAVSLVTVVAVNNAIFLKSQNGANKYSQQGMEHIRNAKVNNSNLTVDGVNKKFTQLGDIAGKNYCMAADNSFITGSCPANIPNIDNTFIREVRIVLSDPINPGPCVSAPARGTQVLVTVKWSSGKCSGADKYCHDSVVETCFANFPLTNP